MTQSPDPAAQPLFQVVKGSPTEEELAAVITVLSAALAAGGPRAVAPAPAAGWSAYWRSVRAPLQAGPGAWQASGRPTTG